MTNRDTTIYRTTDKWGEISVIEREGLRILVFDTSYVQSSMDLHKPYMLVHEYTRAMILVLAFIKPQHVTLLGLGGGCLLRSLYHVFPNCKVHIIELRQEVYEVAKEFFRLPANSNITVSIADAKSLLKKIPDNSTHIIFADLYSAHGMITLQIQQFFITHCHRALYSDGWLVINYHQLPNAGSFFLKYLRTYFSDIFVCATYSGNYILFASKSRVNDLELFIDAVAELEKKLETNLMYLFRQIERWSV